MRLLSHLLPPLRIPSCMTPRAFLFVDFVAIFSKATTPRLDTSTLEKGNESTGVKCDGGSFRMVDLLSFRGFHCCSFPWVPTSKISKTSRALPRARCDGNIPSRRKPSKSKRTNHFNEVSRGRITSSLLIDDSNSHHHHQQVQPLMLVTHSFALPNRLPLKHLRMSQARINTTFEFASPFREEDHPIFDCRVWFFRS